MSAVVNPLPPMPQCPLANSCTRTQVTPRIASPSISTIVGNLTDHFLLLAFVEDAFDELNIY